MFKVNDKVKVARRNGDSGQGNWTDVAQGTVKQVFTDKFGVPTHVGFLDKNWANDTIVEILPIESDSLKLIKYGKN